MHERLASTFGCGLLSSWLDIRGRCFLHKFCYCLTLPTAVWLFAMLDLFHGVGSVFSACLLLLVKAEEPVIDKVLVKFFDGANATDVVAPDWFPFHANMTALETAQAVGGVMLARAVQSPETRQIILKSLRERIDAAIDRAESQTDKAE